MTLRNPRVLLVSRDPAASEQHLIRALQVNQFEVEQVSGVPDKLDKYQLAVINNWDMEGIPLARKTALEYFVKQGGGLLGSAASATSTWTRRSRRTRSSGLCRRNWPRRDRRKAPASS